MRRRGDQAHAGRRVAHAADVRVDLVAGQLAALAGLCALRHLDLQLVGVDEVVDRHAEAPAGHLLDRRAARVAVGIGREADGVLPALAGVRLAAEAVHRDRERLVRLTRDRAERHRAGREALDDLLRRLDLVQRHGLDPLRAELHQPAQRRPPGGVVVDELRVLLVLRGAVAVGAHGVLQQRDRLGVPLVMLAVAAPGVDAADRQQLVVGGGVGGGMAVERLAREHVDADAADARRRAGEVAVDQRLLEADGLEDLRAAVGLDRRDPHLGDRLEQPLADRLDDVALGGVDVVDARHAARSDEVADAVEQQVRVDRAAAVADQRRHVMDLARLAGLEHEAGLQARALAHEVLVDGGDGEQRRDRGALRADLAVGQDQHADAVGDGVVRVVLQLGERLLHALGAVGDRPRDAERVRAEDLVVDDAQRLELVVAQDRLVEDQLVRVLGRLGQQVALAADPDAERHDDRLADRVDRRVGDLREQLLEVAEQRRPTVR